MHALARALLPLALILHSQAQVYAPVEPAVKAELAFCSSETPKINGSGVVVADCEVGCRAAGPLTCDGFNYNNDGTQSGNSTKGCYFILTAQASCNPVRYNVSEGEERLYLAVDPTATPSIAPSTAAPSAIPSTAPSAVNMTAAPSFAPSAGPTTAVPSTNTTSVAPTSIAPTSNSANTLQPTTEEYYLCAQYGKQLCARLPECIWQNEGCYWQETAAPTTAPTNSSSNSTTLPPRQADDDGGSSSWSWVAIGATVGLFAIVFVAWWCATRSGSARKKAQAKEHELREDAYGSERQLSWH